jgi:hypothetical protein
MFPIQLETSLDLAESYARARNLLSEFLNSAGHFPFNIRVQIAMIFAFADGKIRIKWWTSETTGRPFARILISKLFREVGADTRRDYSLKPMRM